MRRGIIAHAVLWIALPQVSAAQQTEVFYRYRSEKIVLTPASDVVAAKVLESVDYESKFPWLKKYFNEVGKASLKNEPVLVQSANASESASAGAIASGVQSKEIYRLPVFEIGPARVVVQNELIVGFKPEQSAEAAEALLRRFSRTFLRQPGERLRYVVRVPDPSRTIALAEILYQNNTVAYAEPNFIILQPTRRSSAMAAEASLSAAAAGIVSTPAAAAVFPSDMLFAQQWALAKIEAQKAWQTSRGANTIRIAVLDDGVDVGHPDLQPKIESQFDMIFESTEMAPPPDDKHGTAVAGIAAAMTDNGFGIAGLAPNVRLIPIRMMSRVDVAMEAQQLSAISNAFQKALELGADVINCSWTMAVASQDVEEAIRAALRLGRNGRGSVVVFAAGNDGREVAFPARLAAATAAIAVGASNEADEFKTTTSSDHEDFWASNFGPEITVVAPGVHMMTTTHRGAVANGFAPFVTSFNGTSSAAPLVAGLSALILSTTPELKADEVKQRIAASAERVVLMPGTPTQVGRINACRALGRQDCRP